MADKKISELTNITGANVADTDEFVVVDTSASETKAITYAELKKFNGTVTADGLTVDNGIIYSNSTSPDIRLMESDTVDLNTQIRHNSGNLQIRTLNDAQTTATLRLNIGHSTGDIQFYDDTGTTPKLTWDASAEALGIGTSSPTGLLHVQSADGGDPSIYVSTADNSITTNQLLGRFAVYKNDPSGGGVGVTSSIEVKSGTSIGSTSYMTFNVDNGSLATERLRITEAGNVGIGTSSPSAKLQVEANGSNIARFGDDFGNNVALTIENASGIAKIRYDQASDGAANKSLAFFAGANERLRIDASGNLLVGKTVATYTTDGVALQPNGSSNFSRSTSTAGNAVVAVNRNTSDGILVTYSKDGTTVGSIGGYSGDLSIGTGDTGLIFDDANDVIRAFNTSTGASRDAAVSLGQSNIRFKDLYLSGGVYLGGTGAANYLDDYEEGTWTPVVSGSGGAPTITYTEQFGSYTKVGNKVTVWVKLKVATISGGSGNAIITGLPFSFKNDQANFANSGGLVDLLDLDSRVVTFQGANSGSSITLVQDGGTTTAHAGLGVVELNSNTTIRFCFNYITN